MDAIVVAVLAFVFLGYFLISARLDGSPITAPMIFVTVGLALGPFAFDLLTWDADKEFIEFVGEFTLVIVLFADASRISLGKLRKEHDIPARLLGIGLPLCILAGALIANLLLGLDIWLAAALGAILAPTDAALGQAVVSNRRVPVRIRQALNVESGLNDGIALPFVLFFLSVAGVSEDPNQTGYWIRFAASQLILGPLVGVAVGYGGAKAVTWATNREWMNTTGLRLSSLALAFAAFGLADAIGGNGFMAAFVAGVLTGNIAGQLCETLYEFSEAEGQLLTSLTFLLFGALIVPAIMGAVTWQILIYALLSLTIVRLLPVILSLMGQSLRWSTVLFLGWFGPRGIASIVYVLMAVSDAEIRGMETLSTAAVLTVLVSVFAHGVTAAPLANLYAGSVTASMVEDDAEMQPVREIPMRFSSAAD